MTARGTGGRFVKGGSGGTVTVKDNGAAALLKRMRAARAPHAVTIGVHAEEGSVPHGEATLLDVAAFHEFGTDRTPRRSFVADWADENDQKNRERLEKIGEALVDGKLPSVEAGLARFGVLGVADVQKRMASGIAPPLSAVTVERKGSSVPLIDTGQLKSSITYRIEK
jgi:hypothetical protein